MIQNVWNTRQVAVRDWRHGAYGWLPSPGGSYWSLRMRTSMSSSPASSLVNCAVSVSP